MGSSTMLFRAILFIGLVSSSIIEAVRPVVSNNEWTPVTNSQRVYLSPEVLARYRQQEAQDRYEVVNVNEGSDYVEDVETGDVTENIIIIQEEQEFEAQKVSSVKKSRTTTTTINMRKTRKHQLLYIQKELQDNQTIIQIH